MPPTSGSSRTTGSGVGTAEHRWQPSLATSAATAKLTEVGFSLQDFLIMRVSLKTVPCASRG